VFASDGEHRTRLRSSLGMWNASATHQDTPWQHYYDETNCKLYEREENGWVLYQTRAKRRQPLCLPATWEPSESEPPDTAVPADVGINAGHWIIRYKIRRLFGEEDPTEEAPDKTSFAKFVTTQSYQVSRLMSKLTHNPTEDWNVTSARFAQVLGMPNKQFIGASDGGLKNHRGAFGWIWTEEESNTRLSGSGPSDTRATMHSSTRTEITGMIAALTMLEMVIKYHAVEVPASTKIKLFCDNRSALKCATDARDNHRWFTSSRCWANYDLYCELRDVQQRLPVSIVFQWVKGHQSRNLGDATWALPLEAQLNEAADKLASEFIAERERHHATIGSEKWTSQRVVIVDDNGTVTGDLAKSIRANMHNEAVKTYFTEKYNWEDATWHEAIDHDSVAIALRKLTPADRRRFVQLRCGWLPVNSRMAKCLPDRTPYCPRCARSSNATATIESVDHFLRCSNGDPSVLKWILNELPRILHSLQTPRNMTKAFVQGMTLWATGDVTPMWDPVEHPSPAIQRALETQTKIGWQHLFQGFFAKEWQSAYAQSRNLTEATYQRNWTSTVYSAMLAFFNSSWKERNESLHGVDQEDRDRILRTRLLARMDNIYSVKDKLRPEDSRDICGLPRQYFQECNINALQNYVGHAEAMLPAALRRSAEIPRGQRTITQFFTPRAGTQHPDGSDST
jgi:ribonuclease HI